MDAAIGDDLTEGIEALERADWKAARSAWERVLETSDVPDAYEASASRCGSSAMSLPGVRRRGVGPTLIRALDRLLDAGVRALEGHTARGRVPSLVGVFAMRRSG
jgi:hypothetical protein